MCGIIGQINKHAKINSNLFSEMRDTLVHRGPDGCGLYLSGNNMVALGHRRLSLIDLSHNAEQPIHNEDKTIWITVNGEIYNYKTLRTELLKKGHKFYTNTDSEVIVHAYEEWGTKMFVRLEGMFAIGIWDDNTKKLILARDRFGIKPLYFYYKNDEFIFASEIKAIIKNQSVQRNINYKSFSDYFVYRYIPAPDTIWENIYKLKPAHFLVFADNSYSIRRYWSLTTAENEEDIHSAGDKVNFLLHNSIKNHLQADVDIGTFLSGGYDSSALLYYQHKLDYGSKTFSIGFENWRMSEHKFAKIVAEIFNSQHYEKILSVDNYDDIANLLYFYDEPIADISILPTYMVSRLAAKQVKAVVSGEGADEIFAGYTWQTNDINNLNLKNQLYFLYRKYLKKHISQYSVNDYAEAMSMGLFDKISLKKLLNKDLEQYIPDDIYWFYKKFYKPELTNTKRFQFLDINTFMQELVLTKIDRASMANSVEVRVPFLDHNLVEYMFSLKESVYLKKNTKKLLLYENIKNHLPQIILKRKKQGFVGPDKFYKNKTWYKNLILNGQMVKNNILDSSEIEKILQKNDYWKLWKIAIMELWFSKWM